jgi:hypothetical protein
MAIAIAIFIFSSDLTFTFTFTCSWNKSTDFLFNVADDLQLLLVEHEHDDERSLYPWLSAQLATPFAGCTVVVTHFAPSLRSADPRYGLTPGTAGFCNALDDQVAQAQLWLQVLTQLVAHTKL